MKNTFLRGRLGAVNQTLLPWIMVAAVGLSLGGIAIATNGKKDLKYDEAVNAVTAAAQKDPAVEKALRNKGIQFDTEFNVKTGERHLRFQGVVSSQPSMAH